MNSHEFSEDSIHNTFLHPASTIHLGPPSSSLTGHDCAHQLGISHGTSQSANKRSKATLRQAHHLDFLCTQECWCQGCLKVKLARNQEGMIGIPKQGCLICFAPSLCCKGFCSRFLTSSPNSGQGEYILVKKQHST